MLKGKTGPEVEPCYAMLADSGLAENMWAYAIQCACVLMNSSVTEGKTKTPHELVYGTVAPTQDS